MELGFDGYALIAIAGLVAGFINTVVGSGSLLTFPALLLAGLPPVTANISNTVGLSIGNAMGVFGYREELRAARRLALPLLAITIVTAALGAAALLLLPAAAFASIAPWLILAGVALVLLQPFLRPGTNVDQRSSNNRRRAAIGLTALTGMYGGYFGAAQGVLVVGILGSLFRETIHTINAIKNLLQTAAGFTAAGIFLAAGTVSWHGAGLVAASSLIGAIIGVRFGRMLPPWLFRTFVVIVGLGSAIVLLPG